MAVWALALDVGGTKLESALVDETGSIASGSRHRAATGGLSTERELVRALDTVLSSTLAAADNLAVTGVGIGSAGPIDLERGTVSPLNLPQWRDFPLVEAVHSTLGIPPILRLDGLCITLAEHWLGALRECRHGMAMVVSTGIGGGIVSGGRLVAGHSGNAGHIGQLVVERGDVSSLVTLEDLASGPRTVAWARSQGWSGDSGEDLARSLSQGDQIAISAVQRSTAAVARGIVSATALLDLETVVLGGGFTRVSPHYVDDVAREVKRIATLPQVEAVRVKPVGLGNDASLLGAAALFHCRDALPPHA